MGVQQSSCVAPFLKSALQAGKQLQRIAPHNSRCIGSFQLQFRDTFDGGFRRPEREIAAVLKDRGLSGGYQWLLDHVLNGVRGCGNLKGKVERVSLSLPALQQLAARRRVKFYRGPRKAA